MKWKVICGPEIDGVVVEADSARNALWQAIELKNPQTLTALYRAKPESLMSKSGFGKTLYGLTETVLKEHGQEVTRS